MIWIVGNRGMLGTELSLLLEAEGLPVIGSDRELSILEPQALADFAAGKGIRWILNCAAYTAVDKAEDEPALAEALNATGPENLGGLARKLGARLLHISTDYVFDGQGTRPYREDDPVGPTGVYGRTKAEGEHRLLSVAPDSIILRTAWLYGRHGPNFVATMLRLMSERERIGVVADQRGSPTWAADLAGAILRILRALEAPAGIYHYTNAGETSWYEFAQAIHRRGRELGLLTRDCEVRPLSTAEYPTKARRPAYSVLSKEKIEATFDLRIPAWEESLGHYLAGLSGSL